MAARSLALATALMLGFGGIAQAEAPSSWQDPSSARSPQKPTTQVAEVQPAPNAAAPAKADVKTEAAQQPVAPVRAARRSSGYRAASYRGGNGATWKTGRDAYGFIGSYGGCRYHGNAGPGGFRLDRSC